MDSSGLNPFVAANAGIVAKARELGYEAPVPLLCECADPTCRQFVHRSLEEFDAARAPPWEGITLPGHAYAESVVA